MSINTPCLGEYSLPNSPKLTISESEQIVPQHYLRYRHTIESIESLVIECDYDDKYVIFTSEIDSAPHITIGIVGFDNYKTKSTKKIVYGRNWRVEPNMPTSEIIQTIFLAIQKAKEHENRELLRVSSKGRVTTPFNNHQDVLLLSKVSQKLTKANSTPVTAGLISKYLPRISYGNLTFKLTSFNQLSASEFLVVLGVQQSELSEVPELKECQTITFIIDGNSTNAFLHSLMDCLIQKGNKHVENNFTFKGFSRFSRVNNLEIISEMSLKTRNLHTLPGHDSFIEQWEVEKHTVDKTRVPSIFTHRLKNKVKDQLAKHAPLDGFVPLLR
ncbi:hypothetical protein [Paraglaciecola sp.]|uniref:hypothetical protein n=1 Tax=Paraglaciecola sp. TaxID=1920173 RepID=UPI003EFB1E75